MDISKQVNNKETDILNRFTLGIMNTSLVLFFVYTLFSSQYLPNGGTGVFLAIISGLALIYVSVNVFIAGVNMRAVKNMVSTVTFQDVEKDIPGDFGKAKKEYFIFRLINSAKMFYILIITTALSVLFFKYKDIINIHHSTIPNFDTFFILIIFSILAQSIYTTSMHFTYVKEIVSKYLSVSYRSLISFGILNFINFLFILTMYSELRFMPTSG